MGGDGDQDEPSASGVDMLTAPAFVKADLLIGAATTAVVGSPFCSDDSRGGGDQELLTTERPPLLQPEAPQMLAELQRRQHEQRRRLQPLELLQMKLFVQKAVQLQAEVHCKHLQNMIDQLPLAAALALTSSRAAGGCNPLMVGGETQADLLDGRGSSSSGASIGGAGGGVKSREGSTVVAPAETGPPGAADTAAKASSCGGGGAGGHGGGRYGVATGRGSPVLQPLPSELSQVMERLALAHRDSWSFRVVREVVRPRVAAVLAEVTVSTATRQQWGAAEAAAVAAGEGGDDVGVVLLSAATAQALANAALLFLPSAGLPAVEAILVTSDGPDNVKEVEHALDKYCLDAPQLGSAQVEFEVVAWADVLCKILRGEKIGALLLDERLKVKTGFYTCQLVRQYEVDHNRPQMPIIGISATVKRADLERYATSGYSAIWGYSINEHTAGKMCNYLTTYKPPSKKGRAEMKRGDIADFTRPFNGFMAFI
eukprot:SM000331S12526  [mRNA]  locus=s331:94697:98174:- [translate_table: standard]